MRVEMSVARKELGTFISGRVLLHHRQRGARGRLGEWVTPTLLHLRLHLHLGEARLWGKKNRFNVIIHRLDYIGSRAEPSGVGPYQAGGTHIQLCLRGGVTLHRGIDNLSVP